jgi:serine/threonine protein kinase
MIPEPPNLHDLAQRYTTEPGVVMGTAGYMSPEQVRGKTVDHRADIFAFGAILYEMLTGKRAFKRSTSAETMTAILNEDPAEISQSMPNTPPALVRVVYRCMEKNPEQRFQSALDLAFELEDLSGSGSSPAAAIKGTTADRFAARPSNRGRWTLQRRLLLRGPSGGRLRCCGLVLAPPATPIASHGLYPDNTRGPREVSCRNR